MLFVSPNIMTSITSAVLQCACCPGYALANSLFKKVSKWSTHEAFAIMLLHHSQFTWAYMQCIGYCIQLLSIPGYQRSTPPNIFKWFSLITPDQLSAKAIFCLLRTCLTHTIQSMRAWCFLFEEKCDAWRPILVKDNIQQCLLSTGSKRIENGWMKTFFF